MYRYFNSNPVAAREQDCAIRAVSAALGISWDEAFDLIAYNAKQMGATMNNNAAWGSVLRQHGFKKRIIPNSCPDCYDAADFCYDHPEGVYVLGFDSHATMFAKIASLLQTKGGAKAPPMLALWQLSPLRFLPVPSVGGQSRFTSA